MRSNKLRRLQETPSTLIVSDVVSEGSGSRAHPRGHRFSAERHGQRRNRHRHRRHPRPAGSRRTPKTKRLPPTRGGTLFASTMRPNPKRSGRPATPVPRATSASATSSARWAAWPDSPASPPATSWACNRPRRWTIFRPGRRGSAPAGTPPGRRQGQAVGVLVFGLDSYEAVGERFNQDLADKIAPSPGGCWPRKSAPTTPSASFRRGASPSSLPAPTGRSAPALPSRVQGAGGGANLDPRPAGGHDGQRRHRHHAGGRYRHGGRRTARSCQRADGIGPARRRQPGRVGGEPKRRRLQGTNSSPA